MPRRWLRFNLRSLIILLTLACVWLGWQTKRARDQKAAVTAIRAIGGTVQYTYQFSANGAFQANVEPAAPQWLRNLVGEDYFISVYDVSLYDSWESKAASTPWHTFSQKGTEIELTDKMLDHLQRLPRLKRLFIHSATPDAGLETVGQFTQLESLNYVDVTDAGVAHLSRLLNLKQLSLNGSRLSDRAIDTLVKFKQLESLYLTSDEVTDAGLLHLERLPKLKRFEFECFGKPGISTQGMAHLQQALPKAQLSARFVNQIIYPPAK